MAFCTGYKYFWLLNTYSTISRSPSWLAVSMSEKAILGPVREEASLTLLSGDVAEDDCQVRPLIREVVEVVKAELSTSLIQEEEEEAYYSDSDSFVTIDSGSETIGNTSGDSDSAIGSESFCVNPFFS